MEGPEDRHALESLGHGSLWSFIGQFGLIASIFALRVLIVRVIGTTEYGDLALGLAISSLLTSVGSLGVSTAVARQLAHTINADERRRIVHSALVISLPTAAAVGLVMVVGAPVMGAALSDTALVQILQYFGIVTAIGLVTGVLGSFFQGVEDVRPNTIFNQILNPGLNFVFILIFLLSGWGLFGALVGYVVADVITLIGFILYTAPRTGSILRGTGKAPEEGLAPAPQSLGSVKALLAFSLPLALVSLAQAAPGTADSILLGFYKGATDVGAYNSVLPLARLIALAVASLAYIMLPVSSRLHRDGNLAELRASYVTITKWILLASLPLYLLLLFFPGPALELVYGAKATAPAFYPNATTALMITATGSFLYAVLGPSASVLVGLGHLRWLMYDTMVSAVIDVVGTLLLAPTYGIIGAAVAFAGATVALPLLCILQTNAVAGVHPFRGPVLRPMFAVGLPVGVLLGLADVLHWTPSWWMLIPMFFVIAAAYFLAVPFTRSLELEDRHLLAVAEFYLGVRVPLVRDLLWPFVPGVTTSSSEPPPRSPPLP